MCLIQIGPGSASLDTNIQDGFSNFLISKEYRDRFKLLCQKNGLIMSVFVENAIKRFVDSR